MKRYIFLCLTGLLFAACSQNEKQTEVKQNEIETDTNEVTLTAAQIKNAGIAVDRPEKGEINGVLKLQGMIDVPPQSMVSVSFPLGGYLKNTSLLPGMPVRRGQTLGILEDMQFIQLQQDYLSAKEKFAYADLEFRRQQELNASKASSDKMLQQAKSDRETYMISMKALAQKLTLIGINPNHLNSGNISKSVNILSPIDGFVSKVNVNIGKYTSPTEVLFELVNPKDIHLVLNVFDKDLNQLSIGQKVIAYTNEGSQRSKATIMLISRNVSKDRMAEVHCHFEKFSSDLLPGMFMNAEVEVNSQTALVVDEEAVVRWQNRFYVFAEKAKDTFTMVEVEAGATSAGKQHISAPTIDTSSRVIMKNAYAVLMKMKNNSEEE